MIPELGYYALILALGLALIQAVLPLFGAKYNIEYWMRLGIYMARGQLFFIGLSFLILAYAFVSNDFSLLYVAQNSNTHLPLIYRFCAIWGAHEGSMLLWVFILSIWTAAVSLFNKHLPLSFAARVLAILGLISAGFLLFILFTSNPFLRLLPNIPLEGRDLNPLLQDPGLVSHPPMLYMGYVGFAVTFAFALAGLIRGQLNAVWTRWVRPWTLAAWCFLTLGIVLGSWWAYRQLGWGGWWFWDPVENASLLPWLIGTALLHSLAVTEKRNAFKAWTALLAICAFSLSLLGTFLVRSGVLVSVHAFAVDPARGAFMLEFLLFIVGGSLFIYGWRAQKLRESLVLIGWSRELMLLINNVFLLVMMATILLGTLYPLIIDALQLPKLSVGAPYFNTVFIPLILPLLFLLGVGPLCNWKYAQPAVLIKRLWGILIVAPLLASLLLWIFASSMSVGVIVGLSLAVWIILASIQELWYRSNHFKSLTKLTRSQYAMIVAHLGVAITTIGITLTTYYSIEREVRLAPGEQVIVNNYAFKFIVAHALTGPNYTGTQLDVLISKNNRPIALLQPEQRIYQAQQTAMSKAALQVNVWRDLYVAVGEALNGQAWSMRIYYKPFVRWIWWGGFLMIVGGILAISDKRYRRK